MLKHLTILTLSVYAIIVSTASFSMSRNCEIDYANVSKTKVSHYTELNINIECLEKFRSYYKDIKNKDHSSARLTMSLAFLEITAGEFHRGVNLARQSYEWRTFLTKEEQVWISLYYGKLSRQYGSYKIFSEIISTFLPVIDTFAKTPVLYAYLNKELGVFEKNAGNYTKTIKHYSKSIAIFENNGLYKLSYIIHNNLANLYRHLENYELALRHIDIALTLRQKYDSENTRSLAFITLNKGTALKYIDSSESSESYHLDAIEYAKLGDDNDILSIAYNNLANLYLKNADLKKAKEQNMLALKLRQRLRKPRDIAHSFFNLANIAVNEGNLDEAERLYLRAQQTYQEEDLLLQAFKVELSLTRVDYSAGRLNDLNARIDVLVNQASEFELPQTLRQTLDRLLIYRHFNSNSPKAAITLYSQLKNENLDNYYNGKLQTDAEFWQRIIEEKVSQLSQN